MIFLYCSEFPTSFEQVGHQKIRVLDFIYENSIDKSVEVAPGDTMNVKAFFSGGDIETIEWRISYNVFRDIMNTQSIWDIFTPLDIVPLPDSIISYGIQDSGFSNETYICNFSIPIPDSIMYYNSQIHDELLQKMGLTRENILIAIDFLASLSDDQWNTDTLIAMLESQTGIPIESPELYMTMLLQLMTVDVMIIAVVNGEYEINSVFNVRYNRYFNTKIEAITFNNNPIINWAGIFKIKGDELINFEPAHMGDQDSFFCIYTLDSLVTCKNTIFKDTLFVEPGYSYFIAVDSGMYNNNDLRDSGSLIDGSGKLVIGPETYFSQWFFRHPPKEEEIVNVKDQMKIETTSFFLGAFTGAPIEPLYPPKDKRITEATLWVQVWDLFLGEKLRPYGSSLCEMKVYFKY